MWDSFFAIYNNDIWTLFLEFWYVLIGCLLFATSYISYKSVSDNRRYGAFSFWFILGILFTFGQYIPDVINGILVISLGVLSALKVVNIGDIEQLSEKFREDSAKKIGNTIFIPSLIIAIGAFGFAWILPIFFPEANPSILGNISIGLSAFVGVIVTLIITKSSLKGMIFDSTRLIRTMGSYSILPQLLGALGAVFTLAGVGELVASMLGGIIPDGSQLAGAIAYCVGMALFTMIMGNAFAAFTVITVGIGIPFVMLQGGSPVIAGALAMTSGFCGTLMTPMAANFNIVPAALLETKNQYSIMKFQIPFALVLLVIHIILMYVLAF